MNPRKTLIGARLDRGLSQNEVAVAVGIQLGTVENAEVGRDVRMKTARLLSEFYERPVTELFPDWAEHGGRWHRNGSS